MLRNNLVIVLCFTLCFFFFSTKSYSETTDNAWSSYLADYTGGLERAQFNYQSLAEKWLSESPEAIAEKISKSISPHLYAGVLRGPNGTLSAAAGNAWDQALLLGNIVKQHGYDVRLARTTLQGKNLEALINATRASSWQNPVSNSEIINTAANHLEEALGNSELVDDLSSFTSQPILYNGDTSKLIQSLGDKLSQAAEKSIAAAAERDKMVQKWAEDYVWVQFRKKPGADWQNLYTIFSPVDALVAESFSGLDINEELRHKLRISLYATYKTGRHGDRTTLVPKQDINLSSNDQYPTVITLIGDSYLADPQTKEDFKPSFYYFPAVNGESPEKSLAIRSDGKTLNAANILMASSQVRFSENMSAALGDISKQLAVENKPAKELEAIWIELSYKAPFAQKERVTNRVLVDAMTLSQSEQEGAVPFLGSWTLFSFNGTRNTADFLTTLLTTVDNSKKGTKTALRNPVESATTSKHFLGISGAYQGKDFFAYQAEPFIGLSSITYDATEVVKAGFDIINSGTIALSRNETGLHIDPQQTMALGLYQSIREGQMMDKLRNLQLFTERVSTIKTLSEIESYELVKSERKLPESVANNPAAHQRAEDDILAGNILLVPQAGSEGWWRVNTTTGNTVSVDGYGRGGESVEYLVTLNVAKYALMAKSIKDFQNKLMSCNSECCIKTATGFALFGQVLGDIMGSLGNNTEQFIRGFLADKGNGLMEDFYHWGGAGGC